MSRFLMAHKHN